jgi:hypothetical protein
MSRRRLRDPEPDEARIYIRASLFLDGVERVAKILKRQPRKAFTLRSFGDLRFVESGSYSICPCFTGVQKPDLAG